jgi:hypothetical protein
METLPVSPRRALTPDEKRERDNRYRKTVKEFGEIIAGHVKIFNALASLNQQVGRLDKGEYLRFVDQNGTPHDLNKKHIRSANARFAKLLHDLKNYLRVSKKKSRDTVPPESLKGTYTPVYAGKALTEFFNTIPNNFGSATPIAWKQDGNFGYALMDYLPLAREGYLLRNTCTMLFYIYAHAQELQLAENAQFATFDAVMESAFVKSPAAFYSFKTDGGKSDKITMAQAVMAKHVSSAISTQDVIRVTHPGFNQENTEIIKTDNAEKQIYKKAFNTYFFQNLAAANYFSKTNLAKEPALKNVLAKIKQEDIEKAMVAEHNIVKQVAEEWRRYLEPSRKLQRDTRKKVKDAETKAEKARLAQVV